MVDLARRLEQVALKPRTRARGADVALPDFPERLGALGDERAPKRFLGSHPAVLRAIPAAGVRKKRIDDKDMRKVWNPEDN